MGKEIKSRSHITILSTCSEPWGGSEELWKSVIPHLQKNNFAVSVLKKKIQFSHPKFQEVKAFNADLVELDPSGMNSRFGLIKKGINFLLFPDKDLSAMRFQRYLKKNNPALVIISQGNNFDGLHFARICADLNIKYVIVSHKAIDYLWPRPGDRKWMIHSFKNAERCFFVSHQNQILTEEQFGFRFLNAQIVRNPLKITPVVLPYPSTDSGCRLACIGRLFVAEKGQDILLRVLAKKKWQERNLKITFVGDGRDSVGLKAMANLLDLKNVVFSGYKKDIKQVLMEHHALVLPSRNEGLPLVIMEAMAAGRMVIATNAGGSVTLINETKTGFIGDATIESLDSALERAWNKRKHWKQMGIDANKCIKKSIPEFPEIEFAEVVSSICQ